MGFDIINFRHEERHQNKKKNTATSKDSSKTLLPAAASLSKDKKALSPALITGATRAFDAFLISLIGYFVFAAHLMPQAGINHKLYLLLIIFMASLTVMILQAFKSYAMHALSFAGRQIVKLWLGLTTSFALMVIMLMLTGIYTEVSRFWFILFYSSSFAGILLFRYVLAYGLRFAYKQGRLTKNVVIVGGGQMGKDLIQKIENSNDLHVNICGVFDDRNRDRIGTTIAGYPILGTVEELISFARENRIDLLIVSLPLKAEHRLYQIFQKLWVLPINIRLSAQSEALNNNAPSLSYIGQAPVIEVYDKPISDWDGVMKNIFDKVIALLAFIALSPVMIAVAIAVKLESKGPVLFKQKRYGFNNELVGVYKFRSMYTDMSDAEASTLVTKEDPRVTKVGRFIRKTSLDELPQLYNVLRGELSLVGPRPHAVQAKAADKLYNDVVDGYFARHKVKPGITGWAQINGWRGETDTSEKIQKRVDFDIEYIEKWSLLLDVYILLATPMSLLNTKNAY